MADSTRARGFRPKQDLVTRSTERPLSAISRHSLEDRKKLASLYQVTPELCCRLRSILSFNPEFCLVANLLRL